MSNKSKIAVLLFFTISYFLLYNECNVRYAIHNSSINCPYFILLIRFIIVWNIYVNLSPDFQCVFAEFPPANQGRDTDTCCVEPDEEESQEGGEGSREWELPVLGDHHVPLQCQDGEGDDGLYP